VRVLLRSIETGAFFKTSTNWTHDQKEALDFGDNEVAIRVARELRLQNVELLHVTDDGGPLFGTRIEIDP
jgi:hypothetical protein